MLICPIKTFLFFFAHSDSATSAAKTKKSFLVEKLNLEAKMKLIVFIIVIGVSE